MMRETGCDAVMIGRCTRQSMDFERTNHYLRTGELRPEPTYLERLDMLLKHFELSVGMKGGGSRGKRNEHMRDGI